MNVPLKVPRRFWIRSLVESGANTLGLVGGRDAQRVRDATARHPATTETLHVTPNRSVSIPNPALHADAARGSTIVASTARASQ